MGSNTHLYKGAESPEEVAMITMQESAVAPPQVPPHILVMEDEVNVAKGLEMVLTEEGYMVDLAMTGQDALDSFAKDPFDLLVADIRLPDINGLEVVKVVKSKWPDTGVVVITGYASIPSAVNAMKLGTYDYLPKPFTEDEIKEAVDGALKGKKSVPPKTIMQKVESLEDKVIQKEEVMRVLDRTATDADFWKDLMKKGSKALEGYRLTLEAKAAIISGDVDWLEKNVGKLSKEQLTFIYERLGKEDW